MTSNRRDVQQVLVTLDDLATAMGEPFATDTRAAFRIIDAVERLCRQHHRSTTGMSGSTRGDLIFRCRRCGTEWPSASAPHLIDALNSMAEIGRFEFVSDTTIHFCDDVRRGIADLIGGDKTPPPDPTPAG